MSRSYLAKKKAFGFSLIEIMVAVVVLATGLLALAALQGSLSRNSAEAKVRGRVVAMLSARMDQLRAGGYDAVAADSGSTNTAEDCATSARPWLCTAAKDAALGSLTVSQGVQVWSGAPGSGSFSNAAPTDPDTDAQFKRVLLSATWTDASGKSRALSMSSDISALALRSSLVPPPDPDSSANVRPVVRQDDPAEAGMIPIAIGDGSQTAATNPKPIVVGRDETLIETKFNVLTYQIAGGAAQVQQRVETTVIGCKCKYGNQGQLSGIFSQNFRPTYWDGTRYTVPKLLDRTNTALRAVAGPVGTGSTDRSNPQSDLCTDCCRDHHDVASDTVKFDPFRTDAHDHYQSSNLSAVVQPSSNLEYNESCRVIRVDGFWRVATDARIVHFGYIGTGPGSTLADQAPDPTYADNYETFVVDHLRGKFATTPVDTTSADQRYAASPLKHPASITIAARETRYQHTHGLLLDYIEPTAQAKIDAQATNCTRTDKAECVLSHIPFTTINLTELSRYVPSNANVISVVDGGVNFDDAAIIQGMVTGQTSAPQGTNVVTADASIKLSNTGLAAILPIDPQDATTLPTPPPPTATWVPGKQTYSLTNGTPTTGDEFLIDISPAFSFMDNGTTSDDPGVRWGTSIANTCPASSATASNPFHCRNAAGFNGASTNITLSGYNKTQAGVGTDMPLAQRAVTCTEDKNSNPGTTTYTLTGSDPINICKNYEVLAGGYSFVSVTSPGLQAEQTTVNFSAVSGGDRATINFGPQTDTYSFTCKYKTTGQGTTYTVVRKACP